MSDGSGKKPGWFWGTVAAAFSTLVFLSISVVLQVQTSANRDQVQTVYKNIEKAVGDNKAKNDNQDTRIAVLEKVQATTTANVENLTRTVDRLADQVEQIGVRQ